MLLEDSRDNLVIEFFYEVLADTKFLPFALSRENRLE
jgi:hypothetical protein